MMLCSFNTVVLIILTKKLNVYVKIKNNHTIINLIVKQINTKMELNISAIRLIV